MQRRTRWLALGFFVLVYVCGTFVVLDLIEKKINPVGWDLETLQKIHEMEQRIYQTEL